MKTFYLAVVLSLIGISLSAKTIVINQPTADFSTTGIYAIQKIELTKKETRLYIQSSFLPKWWVKFTKKVFIQDVASGEKYHPIAIKGGEFDKEIYMGPSGDSSFVLVFPALPKTVKKLHYGEDKTLIYGISLDPKAPREQKSQETPPTVQRWLDEELAKAKRKTLVNYTSPEFFTSDTARLIGYIKGYDPRAGFNTGMIYAKNEITNEDYPIITKIHEDGRFEAAIPMHFPKYTYVVFRPNASVRFYIEPGRTLSMVLNWDDFLIADRYRNTRHEFKDIQFAGPAAQINRDLSSIKTGRYAYEDLKKAESTHTPAEFKKVLEAHWRESLRKLELDMKDKTLTAQARAILFSEINCAYAASMFDFVSNRTRLARADTVNKILSVKQERDYYDFLRRMDLNDRSLLVATDFWVFVNRFEFNENFMPGYKVQSKTPFHVYLFKDLGLKPSADDQEYLNAIATIENQIRMRAKTAEITALVTSNSPRWQAFEKKYKKYLSAYNQKYPEPLLPPHVEGNLVEWAAKDTLLTNYFRLQHNLVYDILKARALPFIFTQSLKNRKESARYYLSRLERGIKDEAVLAFAEDYFRRTYPAIAKAAYDLPPGKGTEIFRKVIDKHKGKTLFIDFWGIYCGPCIASIKHNKGVRESYKDSKDLDFIFITSFEESPEDRYNAFIKENELQHTYRLPSDDYRYLRELFKFNGIPRYIVIDKEGRVLNDDFAMYNFESELKKLLAQK